VGVLGSTEGDKWMNGVGRSGELKRIKTFGTQERRSGAEKTSGPR